MYALERRRRTRGARRWLCAGALLACSLMGRSARAQITPPGLGNAQTAAWSALGVRQSLDDVRRREYLGYVGFGTVSGRYDYNPYANPNIFVFNHEFYDQFRKNWLYSLGLSYRRQNLYESDGAAWEEKRFHELRVYGRYSLVLANERVKLLNTFRPEIRGFVQPDFGRADQFLQFRFRFKTQLSCKIDRRGLHRLTGASEELAAIGRVRSRPSGWSDFTYRESRFSLFYSWSPRSEVVIDVGYMNNLIGGGGAPLVDVHYIALDVVWVNLFRTSSG